MVVGGFMTIPVVEAILGITCILFGAWVWRFGAKNIEAIEAGSADFLGTLNA